MSQTTIRDVVLRLKLEQVPVDIKAPDITQIVKHVETYEKVVIETTKEIVERHETIQRVIQETAQETVDATKVVVDEKQKEIDAQKEAAEAAEKAGRNAEEAAQKVIDEQLKVGDALTRTTEGAFNLAKGFALFAVAGEEDSKKLIEGIAKIEGAYQTLKGGFEIVKGGAETLKALQAATAAATAAEVARAAAVGTTTTATQGATVAMVAMNAASGPVGITVMGITAAVAALGAAYLLLADHSDDASDAMIEGYDQQIEQLAEINAAEEQRISLASKLAAIQGDTFAAMLAITEDPAERRKMIEQRIDSAGALPTFGFEGLQGEAAQRAAGMQSAREALEKDLPQLQAEAQFEQEFGLGEGDRAKQQRLEKRQAEIDAIRERELTVQIEARELALKQDEADKRSIEDRIKDQERLRREIEETAERELKALEEKRRLVEKAASTKEPGEAARLLKEAGEATDTTAEIDAAVEAINERRRAEAKEVIDALTRLIEINREAAISMAMQTNQIDKLQTEVGRISTRLKSSGG